MKEYINRRMWQIATASYAYEHLDESLMSDYDWDMKAKELANLIKEYPSEAQQCELYEMFKDFTGDSAASLEYSEHVINATYMRIAIRGKKK